MKPITREKIQPRIDACEYKLNNDVVIGAVCFNIDSCKLPHVCQNDEYKYETLIEMWCGDNNGEYLVKQFKSYNAMKDFHNDILENPEKYFWKYIHPVVKIR